MSRCVDVVVPDLGEDVSSVTVVGWLVEPGDVAEEGEPLFEVETDKAVFEVEAEASGTLEEVLVGAGGTATPGAVVARIRVG